MVYYILKHIKILKYIFFIVVHIAGALATAYLGDLIRAEILPPEAVSLSVDGAKDKMRMKTTEILLDKTGLNNVCIV